MYNMDFSQSPADSLCFSKPKQHNANTLFHVTQNDYVPQSGEVAAVFSGRKKPESLYETTNHAKDRHGSHAVKIADIVERLIKEHEGQDDFAILIFHNHPQATGYSLTDLLFQAKYDCIGEMYIDTSNNVRYFKKHNTVTNKDFLRIKDKVSAAFADVFEQYLKRWNDVEKMPTGDEKRIQRNTIIHDIFNDFLSSGCFGHANVTPIRKVWMGE